MKVLFGSTALLTGVGEVTNTRWLVWVSAYCFVMTVVLCIMAANERK